MTTGRNLEEQLSKPQLDDLQRRLGIEFRDRGLLCTAMIHSSYPNENPDEPVEPNERLEFLGDALVGLVVAKLLYERLDDAPEGVLTARRSLAVRGEALARVADCLHLGESLVMGHGERANGGAERVTNLAGAFEAVVGAILLYQGHAEAESFVTRVLREEVQAAAVADSPKDPKSLLQELVQSQGSITPSYRVMDSKGPDHDRSWEVEVLVDGRALAHGTGRRKIDAEREAAQAALRRLRGRDSDRG